MDQYLIAIYMVTAIQMKLVSGFNRGKELKKKYTLGNNLHNETSRNSNVISKILSHSLTLFNLVQTPAQVNAIYFQKYTYISLQNFTI